MFGSSRRGFSALTIAHVGLGLAGLSGCSALADDADDSGREFSIVAAFYPYEYVAQRVAGDNATVSNLTPTGAEPHDLELTPQQVAEVSDADLVIYQGGFQPTIDTAVEQNHPAQALNVTDVISLQDTSAPEAIGTSPGDPHLWLDPTLLIPVTERVSEVLAEADPAHKNQYAANAATLVGDLEHLDSQFSDGLAHCDRTEVVTSHAAFGYLASRYGLTMVPIAGLSPDVEPSPQRLVEVQALIEADGITTVFSESLGTSAYADSLAQDLGVQAAVLNPIEGLADGELDRDYFSLMRENLAALRAANGCS